MDHPHNTHEPTNTLTDDEAIHTEAIQRFEQIEDRKQRKPAIEDMRFTHVEGGQWDEDARTKRANRPRFTVNRVAGAVSQIVGEQRQNRTSIKVRPVSSGADEKTAKIFNGLIRNIESLSKATNAYDAAFDEAVTGGYGGWRVLTEFNDDDIFEQDIKIQPINSAASSLYFGNSKQYDKRDAPYAFLITNMPVHEFKAKWPKHSATSFEQTRLDNTSCNDWFGGDFVRIAEYWKKVPVKKQIALLSDGRVIDSDEEKDVLDELAEQGITVLKTREVKSHKVVMYIMNGNELLEPKADWAGKFIPLVPVFGKVHHIEGRTYVKGMVRDAKDPQRIYNYQTSQAIETAALTPKDPLWMTKTMSAGHEGQLASFNKKNQPFMFYTPDPKHPGPPTRGGAPALQQATLAMIGQAAGDIEATTGIFSASLGNAPQLLSERSVESQAEKGDRGAFVYSDNLQKSIQYTGEILVDLIPRIYDTARTVRVLNIDGSSDLVEINQDNRISQSIEDTQTGKKVLVNDLTIGKYDVVTDSGPSFLTKRQESASQLIELSAANPLVAQLGLDIIARNLDINDSEELHDRIRRQMIQAGTVEPTEDEIEELGLNQPQKPDPTQAALLDNILMDTEEKKSRIENKDADTISKQMSTQKTTAETLDTLTQTVIDKLNNHLPLSQQELMMLIKQRDIVGEVQQEIDPGPNSVQANDIANSLNQLNQPLQ